jgi:LysM repeat protein
MLFGVFVVRTGSMLGVTLSHSLTNIVLFLVVPFWLASSGVDKLPALDSIFSPSTFEPTLMAMLDIDESYPSMPKAAPGVGILAPSLMDKPPTPMVFSASPTPPPTLIPTATSNPLATNVPEQDSLEIVATNTLVAEPTSTVTPEPTSTATPEATATADISQTREVALCGTVPPGWQVYVVRTGDTLSQLSRTTGASIEEIVTANCIDMNAFYSGMHIYLPKRPPVPNICNPRSDWQPYTVQPGDTLFSLAKSQGVTVQEVMKANCLASERIFYGYEILLPQSKELSTPTIIATDQPPNLSSTEIVSSKQARWYIASPGAGTTVSGITPIIGAADFDPAEVQYYKVEIGKGDPQNPQWVTLGGTSSAPVGFGTLETLHAGGLEPGSYLLRLILVTWNGNYVGAPHTVQIEIN